MEVIARGGSGVVGRVRDPRISSGTSTPVTSERLCWRKEWGDGWARELEVGKRDQLLGSLVQSQVFFLSRIIAVGVDARKSPTTIQATHVNAFDGALHSENLLSVVEQFPVAF